MPPDVSPSTSLGSVLAVPGIGFDIFNRVKRGLAANYCCAIRGSLRALRTVVDQHTERLSIVLPDSTKDEAAEAQRLAATALQPRHLTLSSTQSSATRDAGGAFAAPELQRALQRVVAADVSSLPFSKDLLMALTTNMRHLRSLTVGVTKATDDGWGSVTETSFPHLQNLNVMYSRKEQERQDLVPPPTFWGALSTLPSLHSLHLDIKVTLSVIPHVCTLTQLRSLSISHLWIAPQQSGGAANANASSSQAAAGSTVAGQSIGMDALAALTGLTSLALVGNFSDSDSEPNVSREDLKAIHLLVQQQLGSALKAMTNLQSLQLEAVCHGHMADALAHMTSLTRLILNSQCKYKKKPIVLPSVRVLQVDRLQVEDAAHIHAPQLELLTSKAGNGAPVELELPCYPQEADHTQDLLQCEQLLRCCSRLCLSCDHGLQALDRVKPWHVTGKATSALRALGRVWQPDPRVLACTSNDILSAGRTEEIVAPGLQETDASFSSTGSSTCTTASDSSVWVLRIERLCLTREALAHLPQGLTHLDLKKCVVKKAAVPLIAALPNLRILDITEEYQGWVTKKTLYILLSQAAAGGRLTINLRTCHVSEEDCKALHLQVQSQRGADTTPRLSFTFYDPKALLLQRLLAFQQEHEQRWKACGG